MEESIQKVAKVIFLVKNSRYLPSVASSLKTNRFYKEIPFQAMNTHKTENCSSVKFFGPE